MKPRIVYLDVIRALAVILIVFTHCWAQLSINPDYIATEHNWIWTEHGWFIWQFVHLLNRDGVPMFTMLTGALMLGRSYPDIGGFLKQKLPKFIAATAILACLYAVFVHYLFGESLSGNIERILIGNPEGVYRNPAGAYHLWYMYMLIGLYISIPFLARMLANLDERDLRNLIILGIVLVTIPTTLAADKFTYAYFNSYSFIIQTYALFALTGYWLHKYHGLKNIRIAWRILLLLLITAGTIFIKFDELYLPHADVATMDSISTYNSIYVYASATLLFSILRDCYSERTEISPFITLLAGGAFGIYLWHFFAVHIMNYLYLPLGLNPFAAVFISFILAMALGLAVYLALRKTRLSWLVQ